METNDLKLKLVEKMPFSQEAKDQMVFSGIQNLDDFNLFNIEEIKVLLGDFFNEVYPTLIENKLPRNIENHDFSAEVINVLKSLSINDILDLFDCNMEKLKYYLKDNVDNLNEIKSLFLLYKVEFIESGDDYIIDDEDDVFFDENSTFRHVQNLIETVEGMYPSVIKNEISDASSSNLFMDLTSVFNQGVKVFGWKIFTEIIFNESPINKQLGLNIFTPYVVRQYKNYAKSHFKYNIYYRKLNVYDNQYTKKQHNIKSIYDLFNDSIIIFLDNLNDGIFKYEKVYNLVKKLSFDYFRDYDIDENGIDILNELFEIYLKINKIAINNLLINPYEIHAFKDAVKSNITTFKDQFELNYVIKMSKKIVNEVHNDNSSLLIGKVFPIEIASVLTSLHIFKVSDLVLLDFDYLFQYEELKANKDVFYNTLIDLLKSYKEEILDLLYLLNEKISDKQKFVLIARANNLTLEQIGSKMKLTRERVRQIESKATRFLLNTKMTSRLIQILRKATDELSLINLQELMTLGGEYYWILKAILGNCWKNEFKVFCLDDNAVPLLNDLYLKLDTTYSIEDDFDKLDSISKKVIKKRYKRIGKHYFKRNPTLPQKYKLIIEKYFEDGFHIYDENIFVKFKRYYNYEFELDDMELMSNRAFSARIVDVDNFKQVDRGFYKLTEIELPQNLIEKLKKDVSENGSMLISTLFELNKNRLKQLSINNRYQLHGVLKNRLDDFYLNRDTISVSRESQVSSFEILEKYFEKLPDEVFISQLKKEIPGMTDIVIYSYLQNRGDYISIDVDKLVRIDKLKLDSIDFEVINERIKKMLDSRGYVTTEALYDEVIGIDLYHIIEENYITNRRYLYNFIQYFYKDLYKFTNYTIIGSEADFITLEDRILEHFSKLPRFTIDDIFKYLEDHSISTNNKQGIVKLILDKGFFRLDERTIVKTHLINFPKEFIGQVESLLLNSLFGKSLTTKQISNYEYFPKIKLPWNKHLLAHLMINFSEAISVKELGSKYNDIEYEFKEKQE